MPRAMQYDFATGEWTPEVVEVFSMRPPKVEVFGSIEEAEAMVNLYARPILCRIGDRVFRLHPSGRQDDYTSQYAKVIGGNANASNEAKPRAK